MGQYSVLKIGNETLSWKYDIPSYLSFLFSKEDFYKEKINEDEEEYDGSLYFEEVGFKTTCKNALRKLDQLGFSWVMIAEVYSFFYESINDSIEYDIQEEIRTRFNIEDDSKLEQKIKAHYKKFPLLTKEEELRDFATFYLTLLDVANGKKGGSVKGADGKTYKLSPDKDIQGETIVYGDELEAYLYGKCLDLPPWIHIISHLFDFEIQQEFSEIVSVVQIKLLLEANKPDVIVKLDLSDIIEEDEDLNTFHVESAKRLIGKINLYNNFFTSILNEEKTLQEIFLKQKVNSFVTDFNQINNTDTYQKGKMLEDIIELIFTSIIGFEIIEKRMSNGDEEIDLIIKNNVAKAFWSSLSSPCIFVECKNWNKKVGSKEIRDFETKLRNHNRLVKIGIFVSYNGFSREAISELKRASRDDYHIVIVEGNDMKEFACSKLDIMTWLEKLITKFY